MQQTYDINVHRGGCSVHTSKLRWVKEAVLHSVSATDSLVYLLTRWTIEQLAWRIISM